MTRPIIRQARTAASRAVCFLMLGAAFLGAQVEDASWSVTVKPTVNPLPIGSCGAVWLTLRDATGKETPRNPSGAYVTLADFDMSVASDDPRAVVGKYDGASSWSVCACQAATAGSSATITATYPARSLAEKSRVPGMKITKSVPFTIKTRNGGYEPQGCEELKTATVIATAGQPVSGGIPRAPATGPAPSSPLAGVAAPVATPMGVALPAGTAPSAPAAPPRGGAVAAAPRAPAPGAPPTGVVIRGTAAFSYVAWNRVAAPATYSVERWKENAPDCCRNAVSGLIYNDWADDSGLPQTGTYVYRVSANYADGTVGVTTVTYVPPPPVNPSLTQLRDFGKLAVTGLGWVGDASYYTLWGPGLPNTGIRIEGGNLDCVAIECPRFPLDSAQIALFPAKRYYPVGSVPAGPVTFTLAAFYDPGHVSTAANAFSTTTFTNVALPSPPPPPPPSDRFRVSVLGFRATTAVADDPSDRDGKGNEVYVAVELCAGLQLSERDSNCVLIQSAVHGDVNGFSGLRVRAGSASATGGIKAGDMVGVGFTAVAQMSSRTFPLEVWEGRLTPGGWALAVGHGVGWDPAAEAIWIAPSLWEWNRDGTEMRKWAASIDDAVKNNAVRVFTDSSNNRAAWTALLGSQLALVNLRRNDVCASVPPTNGLLVDRPIGIAMVSPTIRGLPCNVIGLTREKAEAVLAGPGQGTLPPGIMRIDLVDVTGGQYAMYLKLERLP